MGIGELRVGDDRPAVGLDGVGGSAHVLERDPQVERRGGVVGLLSQGEPVMSLGLGDHALLLQ